MQYSLPDTNQRAPSTEVEGMLQELSSNVEPFQRLQLRLMIAFSVLVAIQ